MLYCCVEHSAHTLSFRIHSTDFQFVSRDHSAGTFRKVFVLYVLVHVVCAASCSARLMCLYCLASLLFFSFDLINALPSNECLRSSWLQRLIACCRQRRTASETTDQVSAFVLSGAFASRRHVTARQGPLIAQFPTSQRNTNAAFEVWVTSSLYFNALPLHCLLCLLWFLNFQATCFTPIDSIISPRPRRFFRIIPVCTM